MNKEERRMYDRKYRRKNIVKILNYYRDRRKHYCELLKDWKIRNPDKFKLYDKKYRELNKDKIKARNYINHHRIRKIKCLLCNTKNNLEFHHINYLLNDVIIVCKKCHGKLHRKFHNPKIIGDSHRKT